MNIAQRIMERINTINDYIGRVVSVIAILMVLTQFTVVVMRYIFGLTFIWMQESVVYLHASLFMMGAAYTLLHEGHVRVDIYYRTASIKQKSLVDFIGVIVFLLPVCGLISWASWPYVYASWAVSEGSQETSGIQAVYLLKSLILVFAALISFQGIALAIQSFLRLKGFDVSAAKDDGVEV